MAGKPKQGLDYAGWDVHLFDDDNRIDELLDSQGWLGFSIYFYLCQKAYATDGYFYRWSYSNSATTARKMGGGIGSDNIKQVVALCLRIGLFDDRLFEGEGVLTSKDIQTRYMLAIEKRAPASRTVKAKYWLLNRDETKGYITILENSDSLPENGDSLPENATKQSKVKQSKVNKSKAKQSSTDGELLDDILLSFNSVCVSLDPVKSLSDYSKRTLLQLTAQKDDLDFEKLFECVERSDFLTGRNGRWSKGGDKASFEWIIRPDNVNKILSGKYDNKEPSKNTEDEGGSYDDPF